MALYFLFVLSLVSLCKTGNKVKAETENKQERKVPYRGNGRRERSMPDLSLLLSWNYFHISVFDRRVFLSSVCGFFFLFKSDFIPILARLCMPLYQGVILLFNSLFLLNFSYSCLLTAENKTKHF